MSNGWLAAFLAACIGGALTLVVGLPMLRDSTAPPAPTALPQAFHPRLMSVRVPNDFGSYCAESQAGMTATLELRRAGDTSTLDRWIREGHIRFLETNTVVQAQHTVNDMTIVYVNNGRNAGHTCWLPSSALR